MHDVFTFRWWITFLLTEVILFGLLRILDAVNPYTAIGSAFLGLLFMWAYESKSMLKRKAYKFFRASPIKNPPLGHDWTRDISIERFTTEHAAALKTADELIDIATPPYRVLWQANLKLSESIEPLAVRLITCLERLVTLRDDSDPKERFSIHSEIRMLFVTLRGNNVWTYIYQHFKRLPERDHIPNPRDPYDAEAQLIVAFGPPGEDGEGFIEINVDNGQPYIVTAEIPKF